MKYAFFLIFSFGLQAAWASTPNEASDITAACVKNAKKTKMTSQQVAKVCDCSVTKSLEFVRGENFADKDAAPRIAWLKKMYEMKLTQEEIDADAYDIFEFNVPITLQCMEQYKVGK